MIRQTAMAAMALLAASLPGSAPALADIDIRIEIGPGIIGFGDGRRVSCARGRSIVDRHFNHVRVGDCQGQTFVYYGRRNSKLYRIKMNAYSGRIYDVDRWK